MEWLFWLLIGGLVGSIITIILYWYSINKRSVHGKFVIHTKPDKELFELYFEDNVNDVYEKEYVLLQITNDLEDAPEKQGL